MVQGRARGRSCTVLALVLAALYSAGAAGSEHAAGPQAEARAAAQAEAREQAKAQQPQPQPMSQSGPTPVHSGASNTLQGKERGIVQAVGSFHTSQAAPPASYPSSGAPALEIRARSHGARQVKEETEVQKTGEVPASVKAEPRARRSSSPESSADLPMPMVAFRPDSEEGEGEATSPVGKLHTARRVLARSSRLGAMSRGGERLHAAAEAADDDAGDGNARVAEGSRRSRSGRKAAVKSDDDDLLDGTGANAHTALRGAGLSRERLGKTSRRRRKPSDGAGAELEGDSEDSADAGDKSTDADADGVDRDDAVGAADEKDDQVEARDGVGAKGNVRSADHDHADDKEGDSDGDGSEEDSPAGSEGSQRLDTHGVGKGRRSTQRRSRGADGYDGGDAETEDKDTEGDTPVKRGKSDSDEDVPGAGSRDRRRSDPGARQRRRSVKPRHGVDDAEVGDTDLSATADQDTPDDRAQEEESRSPRGGRDREEGDSAGTGVDKMGADDDSGDGEPAAGRRGRGRGKSLGARRGKGRDGVEAPMQETANEDDGGMDEDDEQDSDTADTPDISRARRKSSSERGTAPESDITEEEREERRAAPARPRTTSTNGKGGVGARFPGEPKRWSQDGIYLGSPDGMPADDGQGGDGDDGGESLVPTDGNAESVSEVPGMAQHRRQGGKAGGRQRSRGDVVVDVSRNPNFRGKQGVGRARGGQGPVGPRIGGAGSGTGTAGMSRGKRGAFAGALGAERSNMMLPADEDQLETDAPEAGPGGVGAGARGAGQQRVMNMAGRGAAVPKVDMAAILAEMGLQPSALNTCACCAPPRSAQRQGRGGDGQAAACCKKIDKDLGRAKAACQQMIRDVGARRAAAVGAAQGAEIGEGGGGGGWGSGARAGRSSSPPVTHPGRSWQIFPMSVASSVLTIVVALASIAMLARRLGMCRGRSANGRKYGHYRMTSTDIKSASR